MMNKLFLTFLLLSIEITFGQVNKPDSSVLNESGINFTTITKGSSINSIPGASFCKGFFEKHPKVLTDIGISALILNKECNCTVGDFDNNGYLDFAFWGIDKSEPIRHGVNNLDYENYVVLFFNKSNIINTKKIKTEPGFPLVYYPKRSQTGDNDEPISNKDCLWVWGSTEDGYDDYSQGTVYTYNNYTKEFDKIKFPYENLNLPQAEKTTLTNDYLYIATVNSDTSLNVRSSPNLKGTKIGNVIYGKEVKVLKHTNIYFPLKLKNRTAYGQWVYVSYRDSYKKLKKGYVYDYFLDMSFDTKKLGITRTDAIKKFKKNKDCLIENVSTEFLFSIQGLSYSEDDSNRVERIRIEIQGITDANTVFQRIDYRPNNWMMYNEVYCDARNNFKKENKSVEIGNLGHFILWDYNIDGLLDFAIMSDQGMNAGSYYDFYMQQNDGSFKVEEYPFSLFPTNIDYENKTITEIHPLGCCKLSGATYKKEKNKWKLIKTINKDM